MAIETPFLPRIYYLNPKIPGLSSKLEQHVDRCAAMEFDHVLIPNFFDRGDDFDIHFDEVVSTLAKRCANKRLKLLIDLNVSSTAANSALPHIHPAWFFSHDQFNDLPDPRYPVRHDAKWNFRFDQPALTEEILAYWRQRLQEWIDAGISGFRCVDIAKPPAFTWKHLIDSAKQQSRALRFLGWTPGCTPEQIDALTECGFDAAFSSGAWWDYRSRWLVEEQTRLSRIAPPITFPDSPDEPVIARMAGADESQRHQVYRRALRLAATTGNGILIPMGFEFGLSCHEPSDDLNAMRRETSIDLSDEIAQVNAMIAELGKRFYAAPLQILSSADSSATVMLRHAVEKTSSQNEALFIIVNADTSQACSVSERQLQTRAGGFIPDKEIWPGAETASASHTLELKPAELKLFTAHRLAPIVTPASRGKQAVTAAARAPRIAIESISPTIDCGKYSVKRIVGESVNIEADVFVDGHDKIAVTLLWRTADQAEWQQMRMHAMENDRWSASFPLMRIGRYQFAIEAWRDAFATYRDELEKKTAAGLDVALELEEGRLLVEAAADYAEQQSINDVADTLKALNKALKPAKTRDKSKAPFNDAERIAALLSERTAEAMRNADPRPFAVRSDPIFRIEVDRTAAQFSSWYELFPRSQTNDPARHGTFNDVIKRLPLIKAMGFDTLYFPPIHPIGRKNRKGRNNSLTPGPNDPGSPYAIGAAEGGHDAIHPELGTLEDFRSLRQQAALHGLEIALDFAIQCSPDHPWLKQHPDWFDWRPDGSLRYAENPPKKYQDIVNVHFYGEGVIPALWIALRDIVLFWVKEGIRVFRVDNPHTKPLPFWEWMIADIRSRYPDTIFLSEAFTRPKMMYRLAKLGFSQSYTYFTWRHTKQEFIEYMTELTTTSVREYFRPHFFVNTPDINPYFLQHSGRPGFLIRAALATMLSGLWGMYSGFELCEGTPLPGKEEYLDSEKYEIRVRDWQYPGNIIQEISTLNRIRSENPALQTHLGVRFLNTSSDQILYFLKTTEPDDSHHQLGDNVVLVAINLDPFAIHEADIEVPLREFGLPDDGALDVEDLLVGTRLAWQGRQQHVRLDPFVCPYAIWRVRQRGV
ncbi:MAG TPA: maltotransferase domain-containing protein [Burkholderiaceae bacterium]